MGYDLRGHCDGLHLNSTACRYCLNVARAFGWEPAGTAPSRWVVKHSDGTIDEDETARANAGWKGSYFGNDYQQVTDSDAHALAAALQRAIEAVVSRAPLTDAQRRALIMTDVTVDVVAGRLALHGPVEPPDTALLKELADFAGQSGFAIG